MTFRLNFYGGVGEVTGSRHLVEADGARVLLDCGLFQGHRHEAIQKNQDLPFDPRALNGVILSHAHIDHSGGLPVLAKKGLTSPIHCTPPTLDLCGVMLMDSAHLQESDAKFFNKIHQGDGEVIEPLYDKDDAEAALGLFSVHEYGASFAPAPGMNAQLLNAGHVLGSAMVQLDVQTPKGRRRILFTGDLGRRNPLMMRAAGIPENVDYLLIESTYGNRLHEPVLDAGKTLAAVMKQAVKDKSKVLIPSFALERTQEILFMFSRLREKGQAPEIPIYLDSPMAVNITEIFTKHLESFGLDPAFVAEAKKNHPFVFPGLRYVRSVDESKSLNELPGPMVIISSSGMCEGGRILHHLRNNISDHNTIVLIVGYQAQGTLGRRLVDGAKKVKIFGLHHDVAAQVHVMHSLSAHADQGDLLHFIKSLNPRPRRIFLVHGDPEDRQALTDVLSREGVDRVSSPEFGEQVGLE